MVQRMQRNLPTETEVFNKCTGGEMPSSCDLTRVSRAQR